MLFAPDAGRGSRSAISLPARAGRAPTARRRSRSLPRTSKSRSTPPSRPLKRRARSVSGGEHLMMKPIAHRDMKWRAGAAAAIAGGSLAVLLLCYAAQGILANSVWLRGIGLLLVSPRAGDGRLRLPLRRRDWSRIEASRFTSARGSSPRSSPLSGACMVTWPARAWPASYGPGSSCPSPSCSSGPWPPMACLDLDFGNGFFLYCFYLMVTMLLGWAAGIGWPWQLPPEAVASQLSAFSHQLSAFSLQL